MEKVKSMKTRRLLLAGMVISSSFLALPVHAKEVAKASEVMIFDPMDTAPLVQSGSKDMESGRSQHRRVITRLGQGSVNLDVSYNIYKPGAGSDEPYAYNKDELCYFPSGKAWMFSDGEDVIAGPGYLMWRPARAATHSARVLTDTVTICAFAPARDEGWGHKLPPSEIGKWDGDPAMKPKVRWFRLQDAAIIAHPGEAAYESGRIVERMLAPTQTDGLKGADVTYTTYKAGTVLPARVNKLEQLCWLESGDMEISASGQKKSLKTNFFMYSPAGSRTKGIEALQDSNLLCFTEPAHSGK